MPTPDPFAQWADTPDPFASWADKSVVAPMKHDGEPRRGKYVGMPELEKRARQDMGSQEDWTGNVPAPAPEGTGRAVADLTVGNLVNAPANMAGLATEIGAGVAENFNDKIDPKAARAKVTDALSYWPMGESTQKLMGDTFGPAAKALDDVSVAHPALGAALNTGRLGLETLGAALGVRGTVATLGELAATEARPLNIPKVSTDELYTQAKTALNKVDASGAVLKPKKIEAMQGFINGIVDNERLNSVLHPATTALVNSIREIAPEATPIQDFVTLRRLAGTAQKVASAAKNEDDLRLATSVKHYVDSTVRNLKDTDLEGGSAKVVRDNFAEGMSAYSRASKADMFEQLYAEAEQNAQRSTNTTLESTLRTKFRQMAQDEREMRMLTQPERDAVNLIANGTTSLNMFRAIGDILTPSQHSMLPNAIMGTLGVATHGLGAPAVVAGVGISSRAAARAIQRRNFQAALDLVRGEGKSTPPPPAGYLPRTAETGIPAGAPPAAAGAPPAQLALPAPGNASPPPATFSGAGNVNEAAARNHPGYTGGFSPEPGLSLADHTGLTPPPAQIGGDLPYADVLTRGKKAAVKGRTQSARRTLQVIRDEDINNFERLIRDKSGTERGKALNALLEGKVPPDRATMRKLQKAINDAKARDE